MNKEELLSINWLNSRCQYDETARNSNVFQVACEFLQINTKPVISDLGAGTGNNLFYLINNLPCSAKIIVVEQHQYLMEACQNRVCDAFELRLSKAGQTILHNRGYEFEIEFVTNDIHQWIAGSPLIDLHSTCALLDLFTSEELEHTIHSLRESGTPLYSCLNYAGIDIKPAVDGDQTFIQFFENHMSRSLDRGTPLGAQIIPTMISLIERQNDLAFITGSSNWNIPSWETEFIEMNFQFYQNGINNMLKTSEEKNAFKSWLRRRRKFTQSKKTELTVLHSDFVMHSIV